MAITVGSFTTHTQGGGGTWQDYGGGGGSGSNADVFLSGTTSRGRKVSNGIKGFAFQVNAGGTDLSNSVVAVTWATLAGVGSLDTRANSGVVIRIEDTSGNQSDYAVDGADTYGGGWRTSVIDTSLTETGNNGTAATMTAVQWIGIVWDETGSVGGGDDNCYIDQINSWPNTGITVSGNTTTLYRDLLAWSDASVYEMFIERSGVIFGLPNFDLQPDASDMSETGETLILENPVYYDSANLDSCLTEIGVTCSDTDNVTLTRCSLIAADPAEAATTEANRELDVSGATDFDLDTCVIKGFSGTNAIAFGGSGQSISFTEFNECGEITDTGAVIRDCTFRGGTSAAGMYEWDEQTDMEACTFFGADAAGHGAHFTHNSGTDLTGGSGIALTDMEWNGFGSTDTATSAIDVDPDTNSIDIDFNVSGGNTPTLDTRAPYTGVAQALNTVTIRVTCQEADGSLIEDARVRLEAAPGGDLPSDDVVTITTAGTTATVSHTGHGLATGNFALIRGANEVELTGRNQVTVTGANTYTYTITSIGGASGTGTITSTASILSDYSNASGVVENTGFNFTNDQPVRGVARKGTSSPLYKQFPLSGTIINTGLGLTAIMTPDE